MTNDTRKDASDLPRRTLVDCIRADPADLISWAMRVQTIADLVTGPGVRMEDPSALDMDDEHQRPSAALSWDLDHHLRILRTVHLPTDDKPSEPFAVWRMEGHPSFTNYGRYVVEIPIERIDGDPEAMCEAGPHPADELHVLAAILRDESERRMSYRMRQDRPERDAARTMTDMAVRARNVAAPVLAPFRSLGLGIAARSSTPWSRAWIQVFDRSRTVPGENRGHYEIELPDDPSEPHCISVTEIRETFTYAIRVGASSSGYQNLPTEADPMIVLRGIAGADGAEAPRIMRRLHRHDPTQDLGYGRARP